MELSIFLARFLGLYLVLIGFFSVLLKKDFELVVKDFFSSPGMMGMSGALTLMFGLAIVTGHPVYTYDWKLVITLLGYFFLFKGISLWFPTFAKKLASLVMLRGFYVVSIITLLVGLYLTYCGFRG
jgi:hypothetical protein